MSHSLIFQLLGVVVTLGGIFIAIGMMKGKLNQAVEINAAQAKQIDACSTKDELARAIKRSDEMLNIMRQRAEEDRGKADGKYKEFYSVINKHSERLTVLETNQQTVTKVLEDMRKDLNGGFKDIREEIRELRK